MNAKQRRRTRRAFDAEVDAHIEAGFAKDRERFNTAIRDLRTEHAKAIADEVAAHVELINENAQLRCRLEELEREASEASTQQALADRQLLATTIGLENARKRILELSTELEGLRREDHDSAKLRRRLATKSKRIDELNRLLVNARKELAA